MQTVEGHRVIGLIEQLAEDDSYRSEFEANPRQALAEAGIEVTEEQLPEQVTLPEKDALRSYLKLAAVGTGAVTAASFAAQFLVFGAMPVVDRE